jgi:HD superfamily phosphohydrolase
MRARQPIHVRDPIHGSIVLSPEELRVVESRSFQRLRGIKQLGFTDHAFPGATHTRFTHSLGAMEMAGRMFDAIFPPGGASPLPAGERERLRTLLRLAVMLHDVGHAPLSHATECCMPAREALGLECYGAAESQQRATHEDFTLLLILRGELNHTLRRTFSDRGIDPEDIAHLITGRCARSEASAVIDGVDYAPLLSQLVSGELDADRMDYLQRDSFYAGVNYGKFDEQWLLNNLTWHLDHDTAHLALEHRAIFAFEDFLLSRYHMFVSVYYHHSSIGFDTMLSRLLEEEPGVFPIPVDPERYVEQDDVTLWSKLRTSTNPWARRIVNRDLFRRILELNVEEQMPDVRVLRQALQQAGIDHFVSRDEGVLSRYYGTVAPPASIYVINRALGRATRIDAYSKLFQRYAQPARLTRVYCRPDQVEPARACLREALLKGEWEQLRLQL